MAVIMIMYGGFYWMVAGGNEEKIEKAKKNISGAIIGMVIIVLAWAIISYTINVLENVSGI